MRGYSHYTIGLLAGVAAWAMPAAAQDGLDQNAEAPVNNTQIQEGVSQQQGVQEIVVTAQRRAESLMSVPVAVSALTTNDLERQGVVSTFGLSGAVPSLQVTSAFGDAQPNFTMRGIGVGNEYGANQVSPVGIYTDDNYLSARTMHGLQLYDLERIEAVRGPQGTLYGRNTTGGAINFISVKPGLNQGATGYVEAGYGRFNEVRGQGAIEGTLIDDVLGFRASANYVESDGWVKNVFPGEEDANSRDSIAGRLIVRAKPSDKLDMYLKFTGSKGKPTQAAAYHLNDNSGISQYYREEDGLSFFETNQPDLGYNEVKNAGVQFVVNYELTDTLSVQSLSAYDWSKQRLTQEGSGTPVIGFLQTYYGDVYKQFNQELKFMFNTDRTNLQAGVYYGNDKIDNNDKYRLVSTLYFYQRYKQDRNSYAAFAQLDQDLTENLGVTLGIRYTKDTNRHYDAYSFLTVFADPATSPTFETYPFDPQDPQAAAVQFTHGSINPDGSINTEDQGKRKSSKVTGKVGLNYTFDSGTMIYGHASRGYRAGSFSSQFYAGNPIDFVPPEKVDAYEIGMKTKLFGGFANLTTAAFLTKYKNQQLNEVIGTTGYIRSAPGSTIKGVELELTARPVPSIEGSLGVTYLDATYDKLTLSGVNLDGNTLPNAPELTVNLGFDWTLGALGAGDIVFSPNMVYTSKQYFSPFNNEDGNQNLNMPSHVMLDANLGWESENLSLRFWGSNLLNKKIFMYGLNLRSAFGYDYMLHAPPRSYGVTARYKF
ncbi:TonB-dependent receptor [Croceicoccus sp. BE223]|uniref:TonB-dependent receptor n=1 Tax=Croceicoccus sp. BE223 TaxID=2817716 RepID=UPI0028617ECC|nr:TonB-dependent receptor [Croceicoccus sp. BE223]MDR7104123.1 iron complex outermembrane receptor protein [Croceicoccus sp. BE223]